MSGLKDLVVTSKDKYHFSGNYKGCEIQLDKVQFDKVQFDKEIKDANWYILVWGKNGGLLYDGWWSDSSDASVDEALKEAFSGAEL